MRHRLIFSFVAGWLALCQARSAGAQGAPPAPETPPAPAPPAPAEQPKPAPAEAPAPKKPGANLPGALGPGKRARPAQTVPAREPPGAAPAPPTTMDKIAQATDIEYKPMPPGQKVKFNLQDADLAELVNHISGMTGKRFIYGAKVRQIKATVVSPEPVTLEEAYQAFLSILEANGMTVVPHGRFLKIVDSGGVVSKATPVVPRGEPVPDTDRFITRLYRVQNITADEASTLLGKFKSKDGDISVYGPGQLLIITDTGAQVRRMMRIIEEIDVGASEGGGGGGGQHMWLEQVRHGTASDMAKRINDLFEVGQPGQAGAGGAGLSKVVADDQTNSLIVVGNEDSYKKLLELMKRLDTQPAESSRARVLPLQNAQADQLAATLTQMLQKGQGQPGAQGMFEGDIKVIPDPATNSLVISSSGRDYATLRLVVDKLDLPRRQVFIEAVIMDLSVSDRLDIGTSFHGGGRANLGGGGDSLILGGFNASKSVTFPDLSALQGLAAGIRGPDIPNTQGLLPTGLSIPAFGIVIQALATSGKSNILATPHIVATDNVQAEINIGENIPLQTNVGGISNPAALLGGQAGQAAGAGALLAGLNMGFSAPRQDVGNRIKVTPHINESNQVRLEIEQESSAPGAAAGALGAVSITQRTAKTTVVVNDQETVVIGGLMRDEYTMTKEKIPILGDLPVIGFLFSHTVTEKRKANLLLVLTPYIIRSQADMRKIFERKMEERQEFLDRYFVFATDQWEPPKDYSRTNGLVEDIRQTYAKVSEQLRLEEESQPRGDLEHQPSEPIELPENIRTKPAAASAAPAAATPAPAPVPRRRRGEPTQPAPGQPAPAPGQPPAAPAPAPAAPPATPPRTELDTPFHVGKMARNVNPEARLE